MVPTSSKQKSAPVTTIPHPPGIRWHEEAEFLPVAPLPLFVAFSSPKCRLLQRNAEFGTLWVSRSDTWCGQRLYSALKGQPNDLFALTRTFPNSTQQACCSASGTMTHPIQQWSKMVAQSRGVCTMKSRADTYADICFNNADGRVQSRG